MKPTPLAFLLFLLATDALAHRLDEYLQAIRVSVITNRIDLSFELTSGMAIVDQLLVVLDKDHDGQISKEETAAYAQRILKDIQVGLDEKVLTLSLAAVSFPTMPEMKSGVGVIRIKAMAAVEPLIEGNHVLTLTNAHLPAISVYSVNALVPTDRAIKITKQTRDELQKNYRLDFGIGPSVP